MAALLEHLQLLDRVAIQASEGMRWEPLTMLFVLASAWWVKGPLFVAVGALGDARARRPLPFAGAAALLGATAGELVAFLVKHSVDRERPPHGESGVDPLISLPGSPSFPSGHAATAFAAAAVVSAFHPRLRLLMYGMAALVAISRVYLGVHYWLDVLAGAALGLVVGLALARVAKSRVS